MGLPGDLSSASRFVRVAFTKMNSLSGLSESESVSQFFHILGSVDQTRGCCQLDKGEYEITIYTSCCNADRGIYYYTTYENHQITAVDMYRENLDSDRPVHYPLVQGEHILLQNAAAGSAEEPVMDVQKEQEQQNRTDHVVSGFAFYSEKDARLAEQERQKIAYLDKRIDRTNLESVLVIYKKALDDRVFRTPVGLEYLRELQGELKAEQDLLGEEIPPIPLWTNFADTREKTSPARRRIKPAPEENKNTTFRLSLIMNIVMVIAIIAMFIITLNSDQPNVLNYERNLQNKYATWEQELTQREQTVREKERELHIETEVSQN